MPTKTAPTEPTARSERRLSESYRDLFADLQAVVQRANAGEEVFADTLSLGQRAAKVHDVSRVVLGELTRVLERRYRQGNVEEFAKVVGRKAGTLYQYAAVVGFYGIATCVEYLSDPALYWSHLRLARMMGSIEQAEAVLNEVVECGWTVEQTELWVYGHLPKDSTQDGDEPARVPLKLINQKAKLTKIEFTNGYVQIEIEVGDGVMALEQFVGQDVTVRITVEE